MSIPFLRTTTSLCIALMLATPIPEMAAAAGPGNCVPGSKDCPIIPRKNVNPPPRAQQPVPGQHFQSQAPGNNRTFAPQTHIAPTAPQTHIAPVVPQTHVAPVMPQTHFKPVTPQTHVAPVMPQTHIAPVMPQTHFKPVTPQTHVAPVNPQTHITPVNPQTHTPPVLQQQTVPQGQHFNTQNQGFKGAPGATGHLQNNVPVAPTHQPGVQPILPQGQGNPFVRRNGPPLAATQAHGNFRPGANTRSFQIGAGDVRHANQNNFARRDNNGGLSDFQKFGLVALGAVAIGAILSNGQHVVSNSGDRVVMRDPDGRYSVYHDDDALLYRDGTNYTTQDFSDGSILSRYTQPDGTVIVTIRDADGRVLSRHVEYPGGRRVVLFDNTQVSPPPVIADLPPQSPIDLLYTADTPPNLLSAAFETQPIQPAGRTFSLQQIRDIPQVRYLAPEVELTTPSFDSGSSAIDQNQAQSLATLGHVMSDLIAANPNEVFLVEGHSDAVGDPAMNLALSDARAQGLALALTQYYGVPPQNMITQGYGESDMRSQTQGSNDANRRVVIRRITGLLN